MNDKRADIKQIQKYLNGELDAKAMHRLEREAQDDPFLMDALEGYGHTKMAQQDNLAALQARLQERAAPKTRRLIPWTVITIAASVIGFAIVIGLLYKGNKPATEQTVASAQPRKTILSDTAGATQVDKVKADSIIVSPQIAFAEPTPSKKYMPGARAKENVAESPTLAEASIDPIQQATKLPDSSAVEDRIMGYMASKRQDTVLGGDKVITSNNASALTPLVSKAKGAQMAARPDKPGNNNPYVLSQAGIPVNMLTGVVLNRTSGLPIPGATVKVVGKPEAVQTDVNGKFALPNVKKDEAVSVGYAGYNSKTLDVKKGDSLKVELDAKTNSLSEVVVAPAAKKRLSRNAQPQTGWDKFKKYLKENAASPDGKTGIVELAVTINSNGSIDMIRVVKSLSTDTDTKAMNLIYNGPVWNGNANGKPEEVKISVEFNK